MVSWIAERIIRRKDADEKQTRTIYGKVCSIAGIILNILLFVTKNVIGMMSGSIAIMADAFNNFSDAASSIVTLTGFWLGGKRADQEHPFGHGRMEYISGLVVAFLILLMGVELLRDSVIKLIRPKEIVVSKALFLVLILSIAVKLYMAAFNSSVGKKIASGALKATAFDSLSDCISTFLVLLSVLFFYMTGVNIDGWAGVAVSVFVLSGGVKMVKETVSPLLGALPDPKLVEQISALVLQEEKILSIHDMVIHDYGPEAKMVSLHAEVDGEVDIYSLHDAIDEAEGRILQTFGMQAIIHMDPVRVDDEERVRCREKMTALAREIDPRLSLHDFRVREQDGKKLFKFDVTMPDKFSMSAENLKAQLAGKAGQIWEGCELSIQVELPFV